MTINRITVLIIGLAAVAIVAVVTAGGGLNLPSIDLPSFGGGDDETEQVAGNPDPVVEEGPPAQREVQPRKKKLVLPDNPDDVRGTAAYALTHAANLRRALRVLDARRRSVEGAFDSLRIAPGRIDTTITHPDDRRTTLQVRADRKISVETTYDFPTQPGFRKGGLTARDVPVQAVGRLLRAIDRQRNGSAARDVDYVVVGKDIIDFDVEVLAYMRIRTPRPRYWRMEGGKAVPFG
jgi:hypothetical protein